MSSLPLIRYNTSIDVDFDRGLTGFSAEQRQPVIENVAPLSGKVESIILARRWFLKISRVRLGPTVQNMLEAFWEWARTRQTFAFWLDRDLSGYWSFEGNSLLSNDGYSTLTLSGTPAYTTGKYGQGCNITNQTIYYTASNFFNTTPNKGTIGFWFAPNFLPATNSQAHALFHLDGTSSTTLTIIWTSSNYVEFRVYNSSGTNIIVAVLDVSSLAQAVFHYYTFTWDATIANGGNIYLDGILQDNPSNVSFTIKNIGTNFRIGYNGSNYANGIFDDIETRKDVLTADEVKNRYQRNQSLGWRKNYWPALMLDDTFYDPKLLTGLWRFDIEMNFKEVL